MKLSASVLSSALGNILEWYDFGLFTIFSSLFSQIFFPTEDPTVALIATFGIFAIGFLCRPIGALIFGYLGDRTGRAKTIRLSILMISLPTLLIGFLPTYAQIGFWAPVFLTLIRMWQGISVGGEYSGNLIYLAESAPKNRRAVFTALAGMGSNLGILLAALVGIATTTLFSREILETWGWRLPYLISGILSIIIYIFRLRIKETSVFVYLQKKDGIATNPITTVFKHNFPELLRTVGLVCMGSTFYYFCFIFIPIYLKQNLLFSVKDISVLISLLIGMMIFLIPIGGYFCDKFGRRNMLIFNATFVIAIVVPGFYLLHFGSWILLTLVLILYSVASSFEQGTTPISVIENFPLPARYTGVSLGYNLGNGFLGASVPIICEWLATHTFMLAPAFYITCCALVTGLVVAFFVPETEGLSLKAIQ